MKYYFSDPAKLAFNIALYITLFSLLLVVLLQLNSFGTLNWWNSFMLLVFVLVYTYIITRYYFEKYINSKIHLIYKSIRSLKVAKEVGKPIKSSLDEVNREVLEWTETKKKEIDDLKQMAKYRREFLGNVSHELKTPIFNIQGYVLTLLDGGLEDHNVNKEYLLRTEKSINRLISIVEDLEKISQFESGELQLVISRFDIINLAKEVIEFLEIKARKKNITIQLAESYTHPMFVKADRERIREVLINLVDNSIKYGNPENGKTKISFFDMEDSILIEVTDNGPGLESSELPRIFERFYRVDKARSRQQGGSGLGLAIVKHIIEAHEQTINVRSLPGLGTTFAFTLEKS